MKYKFWGVERSISGVAGMQVCFLLVIRIGQVKEEPLLGQI